MISTGEIGSDAFICPSTHDHPARGPTTQQTVANFGGNSSHCSYAYVTVVTPVSRYSSGPNSQTIFVHDRLANHGDGMNVLFHDGHVEWIDAEQAKHMLSELAAGRNPPKPMPVTTPSLHQ